jgi:hypothetical protein
MHGGPETPSAGSLGTAVTWRCTPPHGRRDVLRRRRDGGWMVKVAWRLYNPPLPLFEVLTQQFSHFRTPPLSQSQHIATKPSTNLPSLPALG